MISGLFGIFFYTAIVIVATHGVPGHVCPRHRGLPSGLKRGDNSILNRALYRIDLRHALKGYKPDQIYKLRVHTTSRKSKFNDATILIEALNPMCGAGQLLVQDDSLYSPEGCPDVVTTQEKEPMGRAHFRWHAPSCGCVHIRSRVHANGSYFLEDEDEHNGPLARTVCPRDEFLKLAKEAASRLHRQEEIAKLKRSREHRLDKLCEANKESDSEKVVKDDTFLGRRHVRITNDFDLDRLNIALEQRRARTLECCNLIGSDMSECFGDVRRRRIDTFCGTGEPEVPFSKSRYDWIKQRESDCCWQIGEARYTCFNYTIYRDGFPSDQTKEGDDTIQEDKDDFDPANDLEDFFSGDEAFTKDTTLTRRTKHEGHTEEKSIHETTQSDTNSSQPQLSSLTQLNQQDSASSDKQTLPVKSAIMNNEKQGKPSDGSAFDVEERNVNSSKEEADSSKETSDSSKEAIANADEDGDKGHTDDNSEHADDNDDDDDSGDLETKDDDEQIDDNEEEIDTDNSEEHEDRKQGLDRNRKFTEDECCLKGMTAGTIISAKGWDGCFDTADKLNKIFTRWNRRCDRKFVMCCMRAMDGITEKRRK